MSFAFAHLIGAWLLGKTFEFSGKKKLSHLMWFFLLFGAILPDADFLIDWTFGTELHRTVTHSLLFVIFAPLLIYTIFTFLNDKKNNLYAFSLASGIIVHLFLDMFMSAGVPLLWPNLLHFSYSGIIYFNPATPSFLHGSAEGLRSVLKVTIIDMALGTAWIFYLWFRKRIKF